MVQAGEADNQAVGRLELVKQSPRASVASSHLGETMLVTQLFGLRSGLPEAKHPNDPPLRALLSVGRPLLSKLNSGTTPNH
jgi:hypothetical protein